MRWVQEGKSPGIERGCQDAYLPKSKEGSLINLHGTGQVQRGTTTSAKQPRADRGCRLLCAPRCPAHLLL